MRSHIIDTVATSPAHAETRARNSWTAVLTSIALGDAVSVAASFALAYTLRFWLGWEIFREGYVHPEFYAILTGVLVCCWVGIFALYGLYNPHNLFGGTQEYIVHFFLAFYRKVLSSQGQSLRGGLPHPRSHCHRRLGLHVHHRAFV